jgi:hypothetical protein
MFGFLNAWLLPDGLFAVPLAAIEHSRLWYALPLIISFSLVYGATKHEEMSEILVQAYRAAVWIAGFILGVFAVVWLIDWLFL